MSGTLPGSRTGEKNLMYKIIKTFNHGVAKTVN
jgi:hypothetical protein